MALERKRGPVRPEAATIGTVYGQGKAYLAGKSEHSVRDAQVLLAHVLGKSSEYLYLHPEAWVSPEDQQRYLDFIDRRQRGEPIAYIRGYREFMGLDFKVDSRVLVPRPETEMLVEMAEQVLADRESTYRVADVGCGSGAIGLSLAKRMPALSVYLTDSSSGALEVAADNAQALGVFARVRFLQGDLFEPLVASGLEGCLDAVVSNPPYIPEREMAELPREIKCYEPRLALDGGCDGLSVIRRIAKEAPTVLVPGGWLFMEIGDGQGDDCREIFSETHAWQDFDVFLDYSGRQRVVAARTALLPEGLSCEPK